MSDMDNVAGSRAGRPHQPGSLLSQAEPPSSPTAFAVARMGSLQMMKRWQAGSRPVRPDPTDSALDFRPPLSVYASIRQQHPSGREFRSGQPTSISRQSSEESSASLTKRRAGQTRRATGQNKSGIVLMAGPFLVSCASHPEPQSSAQSAGAIGMDDRSGCRSSASRRIYAQTPDPFE